MEKTENISDLEKSKLELMQIKDKINELNDIEGPIVFLNGFKGFVKSVLKYMILFLLIITGSAILGIVNKNKVLFLIAPLYVLLFIIFNNAKYLIVQGKRSNKRKKIYEELINKTDIINSLF